MTSTFVKNHKAWNILFVCFLAVVFLVEGLGIPQGRLFVFHLILVMPFFLFLIDIISGVRIRVPLIGGSLLFVYILFLGLAALFGVSEENSFRWFLYNISLALIFISTFNHKNVSNTLQGVIIGLCFCFIIYSIFLSMFSSQVAFLIPDNGYQFVYSRFGSHNHLGDFLVLGVLISLYKSIYEKNKLYLGYLVLFSIFLMTSFSRSAYVSFIVGAGFLVWFAAFKKKIRIKSLPTIYILCSILIALILFFSVVLEASRVPVFREVNAFFVKNLNLQDKTFISRRDEFVLFALRAFQKNPLLGVGAGNFVSISRDNTIAPYVFRPYSSHNILLDILAENGLFALICFVCLVGIVFKNAFEKKDILFFIMISMIINFQTDYTHTIYSFYCLFFIILGLSCEDKRSPTYFSAGILITLSGLLLGASALIY